MRAMLYADWFNFRQNLKTMLFMIVVFAFVAFLWNGSGFFNIITVMISVMTPMTLCSIDKAYGWDRLSLSLPVSRREVVGSKFVVSILANLVFLTLSAVLMAVYCVFVDTAEPSVEDLCCLMLIEAVTLIMMGAEMAISFKWGVEKARYIFAACIWIPLIGAFLLEKSGLPMPDLSVINNLEKLPHGVLITGAMATGLLAYAICYVISVRVYQKTEI